MHTGVNDILDQNLKNNEDIDELLLENDLYFHQLENTNLNFNVSNPITCVMNKNINENVNANLPDVSNTDQ